jgi:hypothetical protein
MIYEANINYGIRDTSPPGAQWATHEHDGTATLFVRGNAADVQAIAMPVFKVLAQQCAKATTPVDIVAEPDYGQAVMDSEGDVWRRESRGWLMWDGDKRHWNDNDATWKGVRESAPLRMFDLYNENLPGGSNGD